MMKPFKSFLKQQMEQYIDYRKKLGYIDSNVRSPLHHLDQYVGENKYDWNYFTPSFFLELRKNLTVNPGTANEIIGGIRCFFQFLTRQGIYDKNPLENIPAYKIGAYIPFVFSSDKTDQLLTAVQKQIRKTPECFLKDLSVYMGISLIARCGLRISEPQKLLVSHYRPKEGTIYIEKTKFYKDRLIPVPRLLIREIDNYLALRNCFKIDNPYLLGEKRKISSAEIYRMFHPAVKDIGLNQPRRIVFNTTFGRPTPHSLRHSFAINSLQRIKSQGKSPQNALPVLAAYLGHRKYRYTAVYLKVLDAQQRQGLVDFSISRQEEI